MTIDAYTHYNPLGFLKELSRTRSPESRRAALTALFESRKFPQFFDVQRRVKDLDRFDVDVQVTMLNNMVEPNMFSLNSREEVRMCMMINDEMSEMTRESGGRIVSLATAPLSDLDGDGVEEMRRAIRELGLKGFMVLTNVVGKPIDSFTEFWKEAAKLDAAVYIHPADPYRRSRVSYEDEFQLSRVFGWPYETSLMMMRLVLRGIFHEHPGLKVVVHHMGGTIPFMAGRIEEWYTRKASPLNVSRLLGTRVRGSAFESFKNFYYDTTVGGNQTALRCGYELFGAKRIVFATDYPWGPDGGRGRLSTYPGIIRGLGLAAGELKDIFESNVRRILDI